MTTTGDSQNGVDTINLHVRSYRSALKSTLEVTVNSLTNTHLKMDSILHSLGNNPNELDAPAFIYSLFRLPPSIDRTQKVIIGQNFEVFEKSGFISVSSWPQVFSHARRRTCHYQKNQKILACFAASISDIDDLTNLLIAYQTERNKFHQLVRKQFDSTSTFKEVLDGNVLPTMLNISSEDWNTIKTALGPKWRQRLIRFYKEFSNLRLQLLAGSWINYAKTTQKWWKHIAKTVSPEFHISRQEIYFVSSNTHSLLNLYTGFALQNQEKILGVIKRDRPDLYQVWTQIQNKESFLDPNDFIYFAFKYYSQLPEFKKQFSDYQNKLNIISIPNSHYLDIDVQLFPVKKILQSHHDPRLIIKNPKKLAQSSALIFNIDYPLGFSAYHILNETLENVTKIKGIYILGKAAVLNGETGDIQIPRLVFDEHTQNSYMFKNCFNTFFPFINNQGSILTNQKAVSVLGTYLENKSLLDLYSQNNLTVIEMESGPYLGAITEATYDQQTPKNTIIDLNGAPFDIGIINYTSDTPYSQAKNLGSSHLSISGIEPVNLGSLAILQRIIDLES